MARAQQLLTFLKTWRWKYQARDTWKTSNRPQWEKYKAQIERVIIDGIERIGEYSFYQYTNLFDIELSDSVTYIGVSAFMGCSRLSNISIGPCVQNIFNNSFSQCPLETITVSTENHFFTSENNILYNYKKTRLIV